jgi:hypothetical protein
LRIFLAKFAPWTADFHVSLYISAPEFDFMRDEYRAWTTSLVLPTSLAMAAVVVLLGMKDGGRVNAGHAFLLLLSTAFFGLAAMIMRLKLFFSPLMELTAALICDASVRSRAGRRDILCLGTFFSRLCAHGSAAAPADTSYPAAVGASSSCGARGRLCVSSRGIFFNFIFMK